MLKTWSIHPGLKTEKQLMPSFITLKSLERQQTIALIQSKRNIRRFPGFK
jgi:hypothetical protein